MSSMFANLDIKLAQVEVARSERWKVSLIQSLTFSSSLQARLTLNTFTKHNIMFHDYDSSLLLDKLDK